MGELRRILIFGDTRGAPELLKRIDVSRIAVLVGSSIRPAFHDPLRQLASEAGVPFLIQPRADNSLAYQDFIKSLASLQPDGLICHSYAMLIREEVLSLVEGRAFNLHFSLLPRHRGPNPVQWALIHGDAATGATLHVMSGDFDAGPIIDQEVIAIEEQDTWSTLMERVHECSNQLLDRALPDLLGGRWTGRAQDEAKVLRNPRIGRESLPIDFSAMTDLEIFNLIRAQVFPLAGPYIDGPEGRLRFDKFVPLEKIPSLRRMYEK